MRLNPTKCVFRVSSNQFLRQVVSRRGIKANPTRIKKLAKVKTPKTVCVVQKFIGKIVASSRFISRMCDKCQPFFHCIKNNVLAVLEGGGEGRKRRLLMN